MTQRYLVALVKHSRLYSGNGLGWGKQLQWYMLDKYSSTYSYDTCAAMIS